MARKLMTTNEFYHASTAVEVECRRFVKAREAWRKASDDGVNPDGYTRAAMLRASMDLTRALARLRGGGR